MGISGLLPFLKKSSRPAHVKDFKGQTVAIDSYCWLHKGAFGCAEKLARGEETDQYVGYCLSMVNMLIGHGIKPIMVFDGRHLPSKKETELKRRENRDSNRKKAAQALRDGNASLARTYFERCVDVTSQMALQLMKACRAIGVDCINAPYEADAQLAYLSLKGIAQVVISEDSDLVPFGCERVFFKMDKVGNGILIDKKDLGETLPNGFNQDRFRWMCILSGCDYLASLPGIGLAKALKLFQRCTSSDIQSTLRKIPIVLNMNKIKVTDEYVESFIRADRTFLYQLVFDPLTRKLVPLTSVPEELASEDLIYAGLLMKDEEALQLALGNLDCNNMKVIYDYDPENHDGPSSFTQSTAGGKKGKTTVPLPLSRSSIWHKDFEIGQDFRRIWDEESRTSQSRREAEANVPSLLTDNAKAKKRAEKSGSKIRTDSSSGFFSVGGKETEKPSNRSNLFKTSHSQPQNSGNDVRESLKMKRSWGSWNGKIENVTKVGEREEEEERFDWKVGDDILADYGGRNQEKDGKPNVRPVDNAAVNRERMALFAKVPVKRKMSWNVADGEDIDTTQAGKTGYESGQLFKRAKLGMGGVRENGNIVGGRAENDECFDSDASSQPRPPTSASPDTSPPPQHSISPLPPSSPPPTTPTVPSSSLAPTSSSPPTNSLPNPTELTTPTSAKPTLLFRKVGSNRRETWHQLLSSPKSDVEVRSRYFHAPPPANLSAPSASAVEDDVFQVSKTEDEFEEVTRATSSPATRTPKRDSLFSWNSSSARASPMETSSAGLDSPACSKPFRAVMAKKEERIEMEVGQRSGNVDVKEGLTEKETSGSSSPLSSSQKENAKSFSANTETATGCVIPRPAFKNSPKVMTQFSNPLKTGKNASSKKDNKKSTPSITSFFSKKC